MLNLSEEDPMRLIRVAAMVFSCSLLAFAVNMMDSGGVVTTPEPGTIALLAVGLTGIGVAAWRRNRKR